jgi:hypothetical protein
MNLYRALVEWFETKAEQQREEAAQRWLNCRCGCGAINALADDD